MLMFTGEWVKVSGRETEVKAVPCIQITSYTTNQSTTSPGVGNADPLMKDDCKRTTEGRGMEHYKVRAKMTTPEPTKIKVW